MKKLLTSAIQCCCSIIRNTKHQDGLVEKQDIRQFLLKFTGGNVKLTKNNDTGIAFIEIDHAEKKNAMSGKMMVDFRDCVKELETWQEGKGVILHGAGKNFCSGGDIDFLKQMSGEVASNTMSIWMANSLCSMQKLPLVTLCLLTGPTFGGGAEMVAYCDYIVVADNVKYGFVHGKLGITTAWGGATALVQKLGKRKALDLLLTSRIMNAQDCIDIGFADSIVSSEGALEKTVEWFKGKLIHDVQLVRTFKDISNHLTFDNHEEMVKFEILQFSKVFGAPLNKAILSKKIKHV